MMPFLLTFQTSPSSLTFNLAVQSTVDNPNITKSRRVAEMSSTIDPSIAPLKPVHRYDPHSTQSESEPSKSLITHLGLESHIEGGYFVELDRDPLTVPNPFPRTGPNEKKSTAAKPFSGDDSVRNASTSIFYYLSPVRPQGCFHRNKGRTVHTLISGRGRYVLIHADEKGEGGKRVETFVVGKDVAAGERMVWVVEGGKYKASFLLDGDGEGEGLLISEVSGSNTFVLESRAWLSCGMGELLTRIFRLWFRASSTRTMIS
jgi:predicted cupin superfamily sugar epimerase